MQLETLTIPSASDRWPKDHPDEDAREQPKGGAILLASTGTPLRGAVRIRGLPLADLEWPRHGNRHTTGLEVATLLDHTIALLRSDCGQVHALTGHCSECRVSCGTRWAPLLESEVHLRGMVATGRPACRTRPVATGRPSFFAGFASG